MNDFIIREDAINAINELTYPSDLMDVKRVLANIPSAEPKHGHWIQLMDYDSDNIAVFECSVCGGSDMHAMGVEVPYCWHCGAKMEADHE